MELYLSSLVLEVTRRCNMACPHCMRGDAQSIDIPTTVIDRVLDAVQGHGIGSVTFTGGEPVLNVPVIQYFVDQVQSREIGVGSFFVVTNGKVESLPLMHALINLYAICDEPELCGLVVSSDRYHESVSKPKLYSALKFFNAEGHGPASEEYIIRSGRAHVNGIGKKKYRERAESWDFDTQDDYICVNNTLHISANGNVMPGCDFSYRRIDRERAGNVLRESLKDIIARQVESNKLKEAA
jgi:MoaA/NifB/PqqE/SkfB family radical SAM enzyme